MNKALGADGKWPDEKDPLYALMVMNHVRWKKRGWVENRSRVATPHNPITRCRVNVLCRQSPGRGRKRRGLPNA
jgi:hypothetical protein